MSDIFISYSKEDLERVQPLVRALEQAGWSVWWDRSIRVGKTWETAIQDALDASRCVIVVWSSASVRSDWVKNEADDGRERGILVPVLLDDVKIPIGFRHIQAASLVGWSGMTSESQFQTVQEAIAYLIATPRVPAPDPPAVEPAPHAAVDEHEAADHVVAAGAPVSPPSPPRPPVISEEEERGRRGETEDAANVVQPERLPERAEAAVAAAEQRPPEPVESAAIAAEVERRQDRTLQEIDQPGHGFRDLLTSRKLLAGLAALILLLTVLWLQPWRDSSRSGEDTAAQKAQSKTRLLGLALAGVDSSLIGELVRDDGINFPPAPHYLDMIRKAGGDDTLVGALKIAKRFNLKGGEPPPQVESFRHLEKAIELLSNRPRGDIAPSVWSELSAAQTADPAETVLDLAEARLLALSAHCRATDDRAVIVRADSQGIRINSTPVQPDQLQNSLNEIFKIRAERLVFLEFSNVVSIAQRLQVLTAARNAGIDKIVLVYAGELQNGCK